MARYKKNKKDYSDKKYRNNPYFSSSKSKKGFSIPWKIPVLILVILLVLSVTIWAVLFSPILQVKQIDIEGNTEGAKEIVRQIVKSEMENRKYGNIPGNNIILLDIKKVETTIREKFNFYELKITKKFPSSISIRFQRKENAIIYIEQGKKYFLDGKGYVISEIPNPDPEESKFQRLENNGPSLIKDNMVLEADQMIIFAKELKVAVEKKQNKLINPASLSVEESGFALSVKIKDGPKILFNAKEPAGKQLEKLETLINDKLKSTYKQKKYIDVRFEDMVYYQ